MALAATLALFAVFPDASHPAAAQGANCDTLRGQIAALDRSNTRSQPICGPDPAASALVSNVPRPMATGSAATDSNFSFSALHRRRNAVR
ncbi:MAG: hypothetical protein WDN29_00925 [Methylovirgula sp.]